MKRKLVRLASDGTSPEVRVFGLGQIKVLFIKPSTPRHSFIKKDWALRQMITVGFTGFAYFLKYYCQLKSQNW
jgi:hypothetical protein